MKIDSPKNNVANLPETVETRLAELAIWKLKQRSQWELLAGGSRWLQLRTAALAVLCCPLLFLWKGWLDYFPFVILGLLLLIHVVSATVHVRLDAIYKLMVLDRARPSDKSDRGDPSLE
jgi:hypothetical protein